MINKQIETCGGDTLKILALASLAAIKRLRYPWGAIFAQIRSFLGVKRKYELD